MEHEWQAEAWFWSWDWLIERSAMLRAAEVQAADRVEASPGSSSGYPT
jgi:hypothetical protein